MQMSFETGVHKEQPSAQTKATLNVVKMALLWVGELL